MFLFLNRPSLRLPPHRFAEKEDATDHDGFTHPGSLHDMQRTENTQVHSRYRTLIPAQDS